MKANRLKSIAVPAALAMFLSVVGEQQALADAGDWTGQHTVTTIQGVFGPFGFGDSYTTTLIPICLTPAATITAPPCGPGDVKTYQYGTHTQIPPGPQGGAVIVA